MSIEDRYFRTLEELSEEPPSLMRCKGCKSSCMAVPKEYSPGAWYYGCPKPGSPEAQAPRVYALWYAEPRFLHVHHDARGTERRALHASRQKRAGYLSVPFTSLEYPEVAWKDSGTGRSAAALLALLGVMGYATVYAPSSGKGFRLSCWVSCPDDSLETITERLQMAGAILRELRNHDNGE